MQILVDADACPVIKLIEKEAAEKAIPVVLFCDVNHLLQTESSEICMVGTGSDAADFALVNRCHRGDVIVTQDYGVAAMAISKRAFAIHPSGMQYTDANMDALLLQRHLSSKARRTCAKYHGKGLKKRTVEDNRNFIEGFQRILRQAESETEEGKN